MIRSRGYVALLVLAAVVGIIVSIAGWIFLELTTAMQRWVYEDLPQSLGFGEAPLWWPIPVLALAGLLVGISIDRLPGHGGHRPAGGLAGGAPTAPADLPVCSWPPSPASGWGSCSAPRRRCWPSAVGSAR